ncbi:HepT-like ribonuclease domain-containing protein [Puniceicoccus vermicola]|uniref:DUF86 domain-containing protein n=1 Tax=Puniceicoccus vermicola TaxID=388746 RepID=A0A7X1AWE6_9BACT|nr:DUF86 domain-containing protein [Puniceicoccus vermicola]MBC2601240.1 DUF86 domain-containing protein [Puniceicoccus vermicola]
MSNSPRDLLRHIRDELQFLVREQAELSETQFQHDEKAKRAFVRSLEIIGEAAKNFPPDYREEHPELPWKPMTRMRDKLIHHYFGVDYPVVWDTVSSDIPPLLKQVEELLEG